MSKIEIINFIKFGSEENIVDLIENGTIYCNTIEYFRKLEDKLLRGDSYEGTFKITNYLPDSKFTLKLQNGESFELKKAKIHLREFYKDIRGNIYCLTAITKKEIESVKNLKLDLKLVEFGTHFLLITNSKEFHKRLIAGFIKEKLNIKEGFVKYYDKHAINGELDSFHKCIEFEYQKEFRILIENKEQTPIKFQIGPLKDIAQVFETKWLGTMEYQ